MESYEPVFAVVGVLEQLGVPYMLAGSLSSSFYGIARSTRDADFVVQLKNEPIGRIGAMLGPDYALDPQMSFETITATHRYVLRHLRSPFKVELFMLSADPHDLSRFSRRIPQHVRERTIYLPSPEDVVVTKLRWSKNGNRTKDIDDVRGVLAVQEGHLDLDYVRHWCDQHGTRELLERLLATAI